jgi:hypothetical protein
MTKINEYSKEEREIRARIKAIFDEIRSDSFDPELALLAAVFDQTYRKRPQVVSKSGLNMAPCYMISELFWLTVESCKPELARAIMADRVDALRVIEANAINLREACREVNGEFQGHA